MTSPVPSPSLDWCVFLDVDGTLIELTDTPFDTRASDALKTTLRAVSMRLKGALALVSGRSMECLDTLFAPLRLPSSGLHGIERRSASGALHGASFDDTRLHAARAALTELVRTHAGTLLEDKGRTLAIHYRLAPQFETVVRAAVTEIAATLGADYHVQPGSMMFEIKPSGVTKGDAIRAFMQEPPFSGRTPLFLGDDLTDLDGFSVVDELGGMSIGVGSRVRGRAQLENPLAVRRWLEGFTALVDPHG